MNMILCTGTMSDRQYFFQSFKRTILSFYLKKKKRNWKTWEFESGCSSDEDKEKNIGLFDFVEFYTGLNV